MRRLLARDARMLLLVAPAGYGKTTLARQWADARGAGWLAATLGTADVAELARTLATSLAFCAPALPGVVDKTIRSMQHPAHELDRLADVFLRSLPETGPVYLAIDDYQLVDGAPAAERLVATIARHPALRLLIASRTRPRWVTARQSVYGEILELRRAELALDASESAQLLGDTPDAAEIVALAEGWPAVIGLVAVAGAPGAPPVDAIAPTLYDYLAQESFNNASPPTQEALLKLALLPPLDRAAFRAVFGDRARSLARDASGTGLAEVSHSGVELHPLARAFLVDKVRSSEGAGARAAEAVDYAVRHGAWDDAFALIDAFELHDELDGLVTASLRALLADGRIETLERISSYAVTRRRYASPVIDLVDGEIAFRDGLLEQALTLGVSSAECSAPRHPLEGSRLRLGGHRGLRRGRERITPVAHARAQMRPDDIRRTRRTVGSMPGAHLPRGSRARGSATRRLETLSSHRRRTAFGLPARASSSPTEHRPQPASSVAAATGCLAVRATHRPAPPLGTSMATSGTAR